MQGALAYLARRHETLRTRFVERDGVTLQAVIPAEDTAAVPQLQRMSMPAGSGADELLALVGDFSDKPYQLVGAGVPLRAVLITVAPQEYVFLFCMHHVLRCAGHW